MLRAFCFAWDFLPGNGTNPVITLGQNNDNPNCIIQVGNVVWSLNSPGIILYKIKTLKT